MTTSGAQQLKATTVEPIDLHPVIILVAKRKNAVGNQRTIPKTKKRNWLGLQFVE
jgi:hypothetical protein